MILADTSVWVDHFRKKDAELSRQLQHSFILIHPFIVAELALGNLPSRQKALADLDLLPGCKVAQLSEVRGMIESRSLHRQGIGLVDAHLIASALITPNTVLWSRDKHLRSVAQSLGLDAKLP